jgi:hypothetical protein
MSAPVQLPYRDFATRMGVTAEQTTDGLVITIPLRGWKQLIVPLIVLIIIGFTIHLLLGAIMATTAGLVMLQRTMIPQAVIVRLTADELRFENILRYDSREDLVYRRRDVTEIRYVEHSNYLLVRASGREVQHLRPTNDRQLLAWIASALQDAMWPIPMAKLVKPG